MVFPFGLRNAAATISHLVAQRTISSPTNNEFMGMIESVTESRVLRPGAYKLKTIDGEVFTNA